MGKKECISWLTGVPGNFGVIVLTIMNLYFSFIHLEYLNEITMRNDGRIELQDEEARDPNNPYGRKR